MLFGLLLWLNPVLAVEDWVMLSPVGLSFEESSAWPWVRLGRDLCQFTGMQVQYATDFGAGREGNWRGESTANIVLYCTRAERCPYPNILTIECWLRAVVVSAGCSQNMFLS